ncbi:Cytochrome c oxidase subunit 6B [Fasciolopsis buskii]|uniref:Cytochrome c oxidase subunit 6B n=1 Tax=Fasciolopsis buskii TaxID=27845 RepID=A0A8E0VEB1_9TREM|nr:Cytochrome c oxidase subunit 6B [Fasciolopsis buski]
MEEYARRSRESKKTGDYSWLTFMPNDPRFPNINQASHCRQNFNDYFRCLKLFGETYPPCNYFKRAYNLICPKFWIEEWESQVENGTYPYRWNRRRPHV